MSYLDPRAGQTSGDDTSVPAYGYAESRPQHLGDVTPEPAKRGPGRRRAGKQSKGTGRAGRNVPVSIAVGAALILLVLASLLVWPPAFPGLIAVAAGAGVWEMTRALKVTGAEPPLIPLLGGALLMVGLAWHDGADSLLVGLGVTVVASLLWRLADGPRAVRRDFMPTLLIAVYVPFLLSFAVLLQLPDADTDGRWRILCTLFAVVLSDTGGFVAGVFLGRHKMAPSISPGKTWEGFAGSICAAAIGSALFLYFLLDIPSYWGLLFGVVLSVVAVIGDLAESMLKRDLGLKDMSHLLPGHGGIMDRLDSILFAVPTAYLLFAVIAHQL
ncbi:phosphatidate cytidylyltransferase [Paractinoplanes globisporus]|uniref:Phosphatidate cytidylyltransferase n=1 Tax=Paractinoplanes globisporus TaxID=113565 RepID=A0ABW6WL46_9ACTN|nr:phosphatidate cytidylyltransferase [Actinoplanes globisporus]